MSEYYFITVTHDDIKFYFNPIYNAWYPSPNIEDYADFIIPEQTIKIFTRCARQMWSISSDSVEVEGLDANDIQ